MSSSTLPPNHAAAYATEAFAKLAEARALALKIESAPAFDFSEQTRLALDEARSDPSVSNVALACRLAAAELEGKAALGEAVRTLSLAIALPAPGARGAGNLVYPAFGSGLAAVKGEGGPQASVMMFSSREHVRGSERAPLEAWARGKSELAPAAHWVERAARSAWEHARAEAGQSDYLSARWPSMRADSRADAWLSALLSPEADQEDKSRKRADEAPLSEATASSGRRALRRVMSAQRALMRGLEGAVAGETGVFERAARLWAERKEEEERRKARNERGEGIQFGALEKRLSDIEILSRKRAQTEQDRQAVEKLSVWIKESLPQWAALSGEPGVWPRSRVERFEQEMAQEGLLSLGGKVFEGEAPGPGGAAQKLVFFAAALVHAGLRPPPEGDNQPADLGEERRRVREIGGRVMTDAAQGRLSSLEDIRAEKERRARAHWESELKRMDPWGGWERGFERGFEKPYRMGLKEQASFGGRGAGQIEAQLAMRLCNELMEFSNQAWKEKSGARVESEQEAKRGSRKEDWEGLEELLGLGDQMILAASALARERELAALASMGLPASARALREAKEGPASVEIMAREENKRRAREQTDAMSRALALHSELFCQRAGGAEAAALLSVRQHARRSGSKAEMEAFFKSPMGEFYADALEALSEVMGQQGHWGRYDERAAMALYQAGLQEFRDPSGEGHALSERPMSPEGKERVKAFFARMRSAPAEYEQALSQLEGLQMGASGVASPGWAVALQEFGSERGVDFLLERSKAIERQCPRLARWLVEGAMSLPRRDPDPLPLDARPLKKDEVDFYSLPYGHGPDALLRARCWSRGGGSGDFEDAQVAALLKKEGFAGEAALAAKLFYGEIATRDGADARSRANAWLAAGKRLCKEELGLSEGAYQGAREHAGAAKRVASLFPRLVKAKLAEREEKKGGLEDAPGLAAGARRALRLSGLMSAAVSRGMGVDRAFVACEAIEPGRASAGDLDIDSLYMARAFEPMGAGVSHSEAYASLRRELSVRAALRERFDAALLERADELLSAAQKSGREAGAAEKSAIGRMQADLERVDDWARDRAGAFFTGLNPKLRWAHLRRGEEQWHQEAIARKAASGSGWSAALGSWKDAGGEWTAKELLTPSELSEEGSAMRHCVGSYSSQCRDGGARIFSIRKNGVRALTAQFEAASIASAAGELDVAPGVWRLRQNKGPCNAEPTKEGARITQALQEALQAGWDARVEERLKKTVEALGDIEPAEPLGFEVPGFDPGAALDVGKLRRLRRAGAPAQGGGKPTA